MPQRYAKAICGKSPQLMSVSTAASSRLWVLPALIFILHSCQCANIVKLGVVMSNDNQTLYDLYLRTVRSTVEAMSNITLMKDYEIQLKIYPIFNNYSEPLMQEIICKMLKEDVLNFLSVVDQAQQDRFLSDMASALNMLHVTASTHALNSYHGLSHLKRNLMPLIYTDFDCETINDLLINYMSFEHFKWKRLNVIYDPLYGMKILSSFVERARENKWFVKVSQLPEDIFRSFSSANEPYWSTLRSDRYFILQMNAQKSADFIRLAMLHNMTKDTYYFLITHPISRDQEKLHFVSVLNQYPANKIHILLIHRSAEDNKRFDRTITSGVNFAVEMMINYTAQAAARNASLYWPIRYEYMPLSSPTCAAALPNFKNRTSESFNQWPLEATNWLINGNEISNRFQAQFQNSSYGDSFGQVAVYELRSYPKFTHKMLFPCEECPKVDISEGYLRVVGYVDPPYVIQNMNYDSASRPFEGYCVDVLEEIARRLKIELLWYHAPDPVIGRKSNTYGWTGIIKELRDANADISLNLIEMTPSRSDAISFSEPLMNGGNVALVKLNVTTDKKLFSFMEPFDNYLWFALLCAVLVSTFCFWMMSNLLNWSASDDCCSCCGSTSSSEATESERLDANQNRTEFRKEKQEKLSFNDCLWYTLSIMLCKNCEISPNSFSARLLTAVLAFFTVIIIGYYTANLTAFLAVENKSVQIRSIDELAQSNLDLRILGDSGLFLFLKESLDIATYVTIFTHITSLPPPDRGFLKSNEIGVKIAKNQSNNIAWIGDKTAINFWLTKEPCINDMTVIGEEFGKQGRAFGFPTGSKNVEKVNQILLEMIEGGDVKKFEERWFHPIPQCDMEKIIMKKSSLSSSTTAMTLSDIYGVLIILATGIVIALIYELIKYLRCWNLKRKLRNMKMET